MIDILINFLQWLQTWGWRDWTILILAITTVIGLYAIVWVIRFFNSLYGMWR